jgi:hypothetical protein
MMRSVLIRGSSRSARRFAVRLLSVALTGATVSFAAPAVAAAAAIPIAIPADGTAYFGVHLGVDSPAAYVQRSGLVPASYGHFVALPLTTTDKQSLSGAVDAIAAQNGKLFLTVEPFGGLSTVTSAVAQDLAGTLAGYNARGVDVFLRFAHEMNGSWYAWGQQPAAYIAAFRTVADAVRASAPRTALIWAPNYGGGYPFTGGTYAAPAGSADFRTLDTNGSGTVSMADDPYAPYYPGDAYVDWVGLTLYHFGHAWPFGENEVPEAGKFAQMLRGTYNGNGSYEDQSAVPDFYQGFAVGHGKPLAVTETGALYNENPAKPGATESAIKSAWIGQVYGSNVESTFPQLKFVNWFEVRKFESEANGTVDWRATANPSVLEVLRGAVSGGQYVFGQATAAVAPGAPTGLSGSAVANPARVVLTWRPPASTGGSPVTGYVACRTGGATCQTLPATATTATFGSLNRKTSYTFTVRATNSVGTGAAATVSVRTK